jgi:hypothetical protein
MFVNQDLQPTARDPPIRVVCEHEPLNLLPIQHVVADQRNEYENVPVGDHLRVSGKNDAEAP